MIKNIKEEKSPLIDYSTWQMTKDLGKYLKPYRLRFFIASLLRLSSDLVALYHTFALASIVTFFSGYRPGESLNKFWLILFLWGLAAIWKNVGRYLAKYFGYQVSERVALDAQLKTIKHLFLLDMSWHEKENSGNKLKRLQKGSQALDRIIRMWINNFLFIGVSFVGIIFILGKADILIGLIMIVFLFIYFILSFSLLKKASNASQEVDVKEEEILGLMFQAVNNIRSVKVLGMADKIMKLISAKIADLFKSIKYRIVCFQARGSLLDAVAFSFRIGTLIIIALGISKGRYEVGFLVLFYGYFNNIVNSVAELSDSTQDLIIYKYSIARMQKTLEEEVIIEDNHNKTVFPENWKKITIKNLSFSYGDQEVLKNISFEINRGEKVGIMGLSGAGKSTMLKLLLKENEDYTGNIFVDDLELKNIKKKTYLDKVGVVLQDTEVFNFSLEDNITIASPKEPDKKQLDESLSIAHVNDFIKRLPAGIKTFIGEKGIRLSGGERQRLGIARAIYKRPQLLFLDEATSHLDLESEKKIKDSLHYFFQKVTAIVIAHRLTTLREMDKIIVIEKGKIIESGSYQDLYANKGRFFELWEKQKL